jgi:hypothetical protein
MAYAAHGTTLKIGVVTIGTIKSIKPPVLTAKTLDTTSHESTMEEFVAGMKSGGEVTFSGLFNGGNAGQVALLAAYNADPQVVQSYTITYPVATATVQTFDAVISSIGFPDSADHDGVLGYSVTLKISGAVTTSIAASAGVTALVVTTAGGAVSTFIPTPHAVGTLEYVYNILTAETYVKFTATFAAGTCIVYNPFNGGSTSLTSTVISGELNVGAADTITKFTITQKDPNEVPIVYTINVVRP